MKNLSLRLLAFTFILFSFHAFGQDPDEQYYSQIQQEREAKNQQFKNEASSPLASSDIDSFTSLSYFDADMAYVLTAEFNVLAEPQAVMLATTAGTKQEMIKYATVTFELNSKQYTLAVYQDKGLPEFAGSPGQLFIPFKDNTSGNETNASGRYLAVTMPGEGTTVELDFNRAINPYSAYNSEYSSVIPQKENVMKVIMAVGERKYEDR